MPKFASAINTQKIPVLGLTPETSATAPAAPVVGQLWIDTSTTPRLLRVWDGAAWAVTNIYAGTGAANYAAGNDARIVGAEQTANKGAASGYAPLDASSNVPYANLPTGTGAGTVAAGDDSRIVGAQQTSAKGAANGYASLDASTKVPVAQLPTGTGAGNVILGNDARLSDQRVPTDGSVTGGAAGAGVKIAAATITDVNIAAANKDGAAATPSLRTLGTGASQAVAGNDVRLSDQRTPVDGSVTAAKLSGAIITDAHVVAANKDGAVGTASMRTLGTGAQQAMPGNRVLSAIAAPTAALDLNGQRIINLAAPVANTDAARLVDVQNSAAGIDSKESVRVRATTNINTGSPGASIDGVAMAAGNRVLLTNQSTATENDIWIWNGSAVAMTRSPDTITSNSFVFVEEGTSADSQWVVTNNGAITRGTTAIVWTQFGAATNYVGTANRITVTGTTIDIASNYVGQSSITTLGTIVTGTWTATDIAVAHGGTGASDATGARNNLNASQKGYAATLGAVAAGTPVTITHNLGTQDVIAQVRDASTNEYIYGDIINASTNTVTFTSGIAYAASALRVVVVPVG